MSVASIITLGCKLNLADSEEIARGLQALGSGRGEGVAIEVDEGIQGEAHRRSIPRPVSATMVVTNCETLKRTAQGVGYLAQYAGAPKILALAPRTSWMLHLPSSFRLAVLYL